MIKDPDTLTEIQACWNGIEIIRGNIQRSLLFGFASGGHFPFPAADAAYNLPFIHALAVLNDVLAALRNEGHFQCKARFLGPLLAAAKSEFDWVDYDALTEAKDLRNGVAHDGELVPREDCWKHIDAVKTQLVAWKIVNETESD